MKASANDSKQVWPTSTTFDLYEKCGLYVATFEVVLLLRCIKVKNKLSK